MSAASVMINPELEQREMAALPLKSLPLGFRFHPKDEELVNHYLKGKINGRIRSEMEVIPEVDVCKCEPWDLPDKSLIRSDDPEWFFFSPKDRKYPNGHRCNRATEAGYWKATGKDRFIRSRAPAGLSVIGMKKTLVFHCGRAPKGVRTSWIMHEYRTTEPEYESGEQGGYVLYRLFKKSDDKISSPNFDAVERSGFSPTPSRSSPGEKNHGADVLEEFATPLNKESPSSDLQEPKSLIGTIKKQPAGSERWPDDNSDCSTTYYVKPEEIHGNANFTSDVGAKVDTPETYSDDFPNLSSPMLPPIDYPFFGNVNQDSYMELYRDDIVERDALTEILSTILSNQDRYDSGGSNAQRDSIDGMLPEGDISTSMLSLWDSESGKDHLWYSDVDTDVGLPKQQGAVGLEAPDSFDRYPAYQQQGAVGLETPDSFDRYPAMPPNFGNHYENANLLPYDSAGADVYSMDSDAESLQGLFVSMADPTVVNGDGLEGTGIKIRSRKPRNLPNSHHVKAQSGRATGRVRLQSHLQVGSFYCASTGSNSSGDDRDDKVAPIEEGEHVEERREDSGLAHLDKLDSLSIHDDSISSTDIMPKVTKPMLRLRTRGNDDVVQGHEVRSLQQKKPRAVSAGVYMLWLVPPVVIFLVLCVGIWKWRSSQWV